MKTNYKNLFSAVLSTLVCVSLVMPSNAQNRPSTGGGNSSPAPSRPAPSSGGGGGGGGSFRQPSSSPSVSRPSPSNVGVARPSAGMRPSPQQGVYNRQPNMQRGGTAYAPRVGVSPRGNYGYAPRTATGVNASGNYGYNGPRTVGVAPRGATYGAGSSYRTAPRIGYGNGGGYWGNHGYYHYYHGYYNSYYLPRIGFACDVLPYGYYPFEYGDYQYYYSGGLFYQYDNNQYTVVEPPIGAEVKELPEKAQSIVINGQQYYELNGVYYQPVTKDDGTVVYQIAGKDGQLNTGGDIQDDQPQGPRLGDVLTDLPRDCRKIKVNGDKLFVSPDGVYYQEQTDNNGNKTYKVVGLPTDDQNEQN